MKMPAQVNQLKFYQEAVKKNIPIESRYEGVSLFLSWHKAPRWRAQCGHANNPIIIGTYPFTEAGEKAAANTYLAYVRDALTNQPGLPPVQNKPNTPTSAKHLATRNLKSKVA